MTRRRITPGFTLLETLIVVTIISIVAGSLLPVITRPYVSQYRAQTLAELQSLETAVVGHPELGDYGFLGTMGRLPSTVVVGGVSQPGLAELWLQGTNNALQLGTGGVPMGWNGSYLRTQYSRPDLDPWGGQITIDLNTAAGHPDQWRFRSNGPDGIKNTSDDIFYPAPDTAGNNGYFQSIGTLTVDLFETDGMNIAYPTTISPATAVAQLMVPTASGAECVLNATCPACSITNGLGQPTRITCSNVPFGVHQLQLQAGAVTQGENFTVTRVNSYGRMFVNPVTGANGETLTTAAPLFTPVGGNSFSNTSKQISGVISMAPMSLQTYLDVEVVGTVSVNGLDTATTCKVQLTANGTLIGQVSIMGMTEQEVPFRISANPTTPGVGNLLTIAANTNIPTIAVMGVAAGVAPCRFGATVPGQSSVQTVISQYYTQ